MTAPKPPLPPEPMTASAPIASFTLASLVKLCPCVPGPGLHGPAAKGDGALQGGPDIMTRGRLISRQWSSILTGLSSPRPSSLASPPIPPVRSLRTPLPPNHSIPDTDGRIMALTNHAEQPGLDTLEHADGKRHGKEERTWKLLAVTATLLLIGFIAYVATRPHSPRPAAYPVTPPATLAIGSEAPSFVLPRLGGGQPVSLARTRGTPTIINFFASWCRNCQAELSAFAALSAHAAGQVAIVGVDSNDANAAAAQRLLAGAEATYPVGVDSDAKVATSFLLNALPVTYFLDANGRVVHVAFGAQSLTSLDHWEAVLTSKSVP
jgi:cytochrome c biogenesis protein CcmG/thiol:disulfide interchange protein DsbE